MISSPAGWLVSGYGQRRAPTRAVVFTGCAGIGAVRSLRSQNWPRLGLSGCIRTLSSRSRGKRGTKSRRKTRYAPRSADLRVRRARWRLGSPSLRRKYRNATGKAGRCLRGRTCKAPCRPPGEVTTAEPSGTSQAPPGQLSSGSSLAWSKPGGSWRRAITWTSMPRSPARRITLRTMGPPPVISCQRLLWLEPRTI